MHALEEDTLSRRVGTLLSLFKFNQVYRLDRPGISSCSGLIYDTTFFDKLVMQYYFAPVLA